MKKYILINSSIGVDEKSDTGAQLKSEFSKAVKGKSVGKYRHQVEFETSDIEKVKKKFPGYRFKEIKNISQALQSLTLFLVIIIAGDFEFDHMDDAEIAAYKVLAENKSQARKKAYTAEVSRQYDMFVKFKKKEKDTSPTPDRSTFKMGDFHDLYRAQITELSKIDLIE